MSSGIAIARSLIKTWKKPRGDPLLFPNMDLSWPDDLRLQHLEVSLDTKLPLQALCCKAVTGTFTILKV